MQQFFRLTVCATFAFFVVASYMMSNPPFTVVMKLFSIGSPNSGVPSELRYINEPSEEIQGYVVWSTGCRIVDVSPWAKSLEGYIRKKNPITCPGKRLSRITGKMYNRTLEISPTLLTTSCCLRTIDRTDNTSDHVKYPDNIYKISECQVVNLTTSLPEETQYIWVKCIKEGTPVEEVYSNMHGFVGKSEAVEEKLQLQTEEFKAGKLSVLLIGIDSISRLNLIRTMPKVVKYLNENGWIDFKGYNKIDDNTFPNLMAILTGQTVEQISSSCWPTRYTKIDNCPFIWKDFSSKGYVTCYFEDKPYISTFNYFKKGFAKSPTDYYSRPYLLAANRHLKIETIDGLELCMGPNHSVDFILDYALDFTRVFHNALYFALFWMNSFSHNDVNMPSAYDDKILQFLKDLELSGTLNSTLVVFLSDHGMRFGEIRETFHGWLEERLPFLYFWIPEWFRSRHPHKFKNLLTNGNRLSSPFDLHLTLKEMIEKERDKAQGCKSCHSLLEQVQWNRTCQEAGIGGHWCTCFQYKSLPPEGTEANNMAQVAVEYINSLISNVTKDKIKPNTSCSPLKLERVLTYRRSVPPGPKQVVVLIKTLPGNALFEATIAPDQSPHIFDTISRINAYDHQSYCISDWYLKKYCFCQNKHR